MAQKEQSNASPADIEQHLGGVDYPANKQELKQHAQDQNAPEEVVNVIERMPDEQYSSAADVAKGVGTTQ